MSKCKAEPIPDLLEALEDLLWWMPDTLCLQEPDHPLRVALAAIAKERGDT